LSYESKENCFAALYIATACAKKTSMNLGDPTVLAIIGGGAVIAGIWIARHFFSGDARWERRRRRSNARISSRARRPSIKFSVRTKKSRRK
jgi:hypothetical protein